jgi:MoCo/4Fe-4S cofactor protein with predicted Tat translocation signal
MPNQKKYWKSEVELNNQSTLAEDLAQKEFFKNSLKIF